GRGSAGTDARRAAVPSERARDPRSAPVGGLLRVSHRRDEDAMTTIESETTDALTELPALLAEEPAVRAVIDRAPVVAVPGPAPALSPAAPAPVTTPPPGLLPPPPAGRTQPGPPRPPPPPRPRRAPAPLPPP